jgi:hypothetical protein
MEHIEEIETVLKPNVKTNDKTNDKTNVKTNVKTNDKTNVKTNDKPNEKRIILKLNNFIDCDDYEHGSSYWNRVNGLPDDF